MSTITDEVHPLGHSHSEAVLQIDGQSVDPVVHCLHPVCGEGDREGKEQQAA